MRSSTPASRMALRAAKSSLACSSPLGSIPMNPTATYKTVRANAQLASGRAATGMS